MGSHDYSNARAQGRENSRWKDERIAELEKQRGNSAELTEDILRAKNKRIAELEARERELVELLDEARTTIDAFGYELAKRQAAEAGHHTRKRMNSLLAKIDKEKDGG